MNNPLKTIQSAIELRMKQRSGHVLDALKRARDAVQHLQGMDCRVESVEIRNDYVVVHIAPPPHRRLGGSIHVRRVNGYHRETLYVTRVLDCQVEWIVRHAHPLLRSVSA